MTFVVAIDGPVGSGKGSITKLVGEEIGLINIDTGAMYRSVSLNIIREKVKLDDIEAISRILDNIKLDFKKESTKLPLKYGSNKILEIHAIL